MRRWRPQVTELPPAVRQAAEAVERLEIVLYPFWEVDVAVRVKAPLLPAVTRLWRVAVDGITGAPVTVPPQLEVMDEPLDAARAERQVDFAVAVESLDQERMRRVLWEHASRRVRSWMNVSIALGAARPVYKELHLFAVTFRDGAGARLALDTLTGEYGVVAPAPGGAGAG
ncbi:MAG: hypothetical protein QN123_11145 [Armatimonadota bacterium]|nr:hypothetical protein [Armatimonadota bacterium]